MLYKINSIFKDDTKLHPMYNIKSYDNSGIYYT